MSARPEPGSYCPDCGKRLSGGERPICPGCGFILYRNPITGVAVIVRDEVGRVLVGRRASGPYEGLWCIPCGYVEYDEEIREAAVREIQEETGLTVEPGALFAVHSNFHRPEKQTVGVWFLGTVLAGDLRPADGEFTELAYVSPSAPPPLAFPTDELVMADLAGAGGRPLASSHPLLPLAFDVANSAGSLVRHLQSKGIADVATKSSGVDMVTNIDRAAEEHIVESLLAVRPGDGIVGEEGASRSSSTDVRWIIDPVDGTTNLLYGIPAVAVVLAMERAGVVEAGVIHDVASRETYWSAAGAGAFRGGTQLHVTTVEEPGTALIATGFGYQSAQRAAQADRLRRILPHVRDVRRSGSAALDLCRVAAGQVDGYYEDGLHRWDFEAGALLVREAGGSVSFAGEVLVASGPGIHPFLMEMLTATAEDDGGASK